MVVRCVDQDNRTVGGGRLLSSPSCGLRLGHLQRVELGALGHTPNNLCIKEFDFYFHFVGGCRYMTTSLF